MKPFYTVKLDISAVHLPQQALTTNANCDPLVPVLCIQPFFIIPTVFSMSEGHMEQEQIISGRIAVAIYAET